MKRNKYYITETRTASFSSFAYGVTAEEALSNFKEHRRVAEAETGWNNMKTTTKVEVECWGEFLDYQGNPGIYCGEEKT